MLTSRNLTNVIALAALATFAHSDGAFADVVNQNTATLNNNIDTSLSDAEIPGNMLLMEATGLTLAPKAGQVLMDLGGEIGTINSRVTFPDGLGNNQTIRFSTAQNDQMLAAAVGVGAGFFVGASGVYETLSNDFQGSLSSKTDGLMEPTIAVGYRTNLSNIKLIPTLSVLPSIGASRSTVDSSNVNLSDAKSGGSAVIPSIQLEMPVGRSVDLGLRLSYAILGTRYSQSIDSQNSISNSSTTGGNNTNVISYLQMDLTNKLSLGASLGLFFSDKSSNFDGFGNKQSDSSGTTLGSAGIDMPIKITSNIKIIPQIAYLRSMSDGGGIEWSDYGLKAKFSF